MSILNYPETFDAQTLSETNLSSFFLFPQKNGNSLP